MADPRWSPTSTTKQSPPITTADLNRRIMIAFDQSGQLQDVQYGPGMERRLRGTARRLSPMRVPFFDDGGRQSIYNITWQARIVLNFRRFGEPPLPKNA